MNAKSQRKANFPADEPAEDWHYADVIAQLHKKGYTLASLAEKYGLKSGGTLSKALRNSFPIAEQRIADALEIHPKDIWPSRYNLDGTRKLQGFHAIQSTRRRPYVNGKDSAVNSHEEV